MRSCTTARSRTSRRSWPGLEKRGHERRSDTDTEVVAHLIEERYDGDLAATVRSVCKDLEGSFVLVVAHRDEPDLVVAARRNLPLVDRPRRGENFLGTDVTAFIAHTREARAVDQDQVVELRRTGVTVTDLDGNAVEGESFHVDWDTAAAEKGGHEFFMLKEIEEQPAAVRETLGGRLTADGLLHLDELAMSDEDIRGIEQVVIIACGSSYHSGLVGKYAIERWCRLPVHVEMASEFRYRDPVVGRNTLVIAISQSGETADTLEALRHARSQKAWVLAVTNTVGSTVSRESDAAFYTRGGPRSRSPRRRPSSRSSRRCTSSGSTSRRSAAPATPTRSAPTCATCRRSPSWSRRSCRGWSRSASWPGSSSTRSACCSSAGTSASRWRSRAR